MFEAVIRALQKVDVSLGRATPLSGVTVSSVTQQLGGPGTRTPQQAGAANGWFGPGAPLNPVAPPDVAGRMFDFPTNYNLTQQPRAYDGFSFGQLRSVADAYDLLRLVIETRKDQIEGFEWEIAPKEGKTVSAGTIEAANQFFQYPDREHDFPTWLRMVVEDVLVIDTVAVYPRQTRGGGLYSLELVDGGTIKRVLDQYGRTPTPDVGPAYQQVLKGLPAVDYTLDELVYTSRNPRTNRIYGYSPVEQVTMTVNIALRRQISQLQFYTEGNIPEAIAGVPETWSMDTLKQFQLYWDAMLEGNTAQRRRMKFVPLDASKIHFPKADVMKDAFDEWLARIICFAFSIPPTALIKEVNRATAQTSADTALSEGLIPLLNWFKLFFDRLIQRHYKQPDLEFRWQMKKEIAPLDQAQVDQIYLAANVYDIDTVRMRLGMPELTPEQKAEIAAKTATPPQPLQFGPTGLPIDPSKSVAEIADEHRQQLDASTAAKTKEESVKKFDVKTENEQLRDTLSKTLESGLSGIATALGSQHPTTPPAINTVVNMPEQAFTIHVPERAVTFAAPNITVEAPNITVAAPSVTVPITVPAAKTVTQTVKGERQPDGSLLATVIKETTHEAE